MSGDDELERLKRRKMQELQRLQAQKQAQDAAKAALPPAPKQPTNEDILGSYFGDRAWEVWNAAKAQYPKVAPQVEAALVQAIRDGKIREKIDGAALAQFFRTVGLPVNLGTSIRFAEHGELKSISDKLKSE